MPDHHTRKRCRKGGIFLQKRNSERQDGELETGGDAEEGGLKDALWEDARDLDGKGRKKKRRKENFGSFSGDKSEEFSNSTDDKHCCEDTKSDIKQDGDEKHNIKVGEPALAESNSSLTSFQLLRELRNRDLPESRKIELAWMFTEACSWQSNGQKGKKALTTDEMLSAPQFISFLSEWIQSSLMASAKQLSAYLDTSHKHSISSLGSCDRTPSAACFDARYWSVLKWCLQSGFLQTAGVVSQGLIRPLSLVLTVAGETLRNCRLSSSEATCIEGNDLTDPGKVTELDARGKHVLEPAFLKAFVDVIKLLFRTYQRAFRPDLNSWILFASMVLDLVILLQYGSMNNTFINSVSLLYHLAAITVEAFSRFASSHPKPKKIFQTVINRLLESLLRILGILYAEDEASKIETVYSREKKMLLDGLEDLLKRVLFHPAHLEGYLEICSCTEQNTEFLDSVSEVKDISSPNKRKFINGYQEEDSATMLSYHKLLFQQLDHFRRGRKIQTWGAFSFILKTFVQEVRARELHRSRDACCLQGKRASPGFAVSEPSTNMEDNLLAKSVRDFTKNPNIFVQTHDVGHLKLTSQRLFQFFSKLISPLIKDLKGLLVSFSFKESTVKPLHIHLLLRAVNKMLGVARDEHLYIPTEDTSNRTHFYLIQCIFYVIIDLSSLGPKLSSSLNINFQPLTEVEEAKMQSRFEEDQYDFYTQLSAFSREVVCGISHTLELEYRVMEQNLKDIWLIIFSNVAVQCRIKEVFQTKDAFAEDAILVASQLVKLFSDLRQVDRPLYDLCRTLRFFMHPRGILGGKKLVVEEDIKNELKVATSCLASKHCAMAIESVVCSFQFLETVHLAIRCLPEGQVACFIHSLKEDVDCTLMFFVMTGKNTTECESVLLHSGGNALMELYIGFLNNSNVSTSNSGQVGRSVRDLMVYGLSPVLNILVDECTSDPIDLINIFRLRLVRSIAESVKQSFTGEIFCLDEPSVLEGKDGWSLICSLIIAVVLRLYMSSRSLHRECISLMSPAAAEKASKAANDTAMIGFSTNWMQPGLLLHKHFPFPHIENVSVSVYNLLTWLDAAFKKGYEQAPALSYTLFGIALQNLVDFNRDLKSINFFLDEMELKNSCIIPVDFINEVDDSVTTEEICTFHIKRGKKKEDYRKLHELVEELRQEASSLASFMVRSVQQLHKSFRRSNQIDDYNPKGRCRKKSERNCDMVPSDMKKSLLKTSWALLCQNIDIWAKYASGSDVEKFVCILLSVTSESNLSQVVPLEKNSEEGLEDPRYYAEKLFKSSQFYEQKVIRKALLTNICSELEGCLASINRDASTFSCPKRIIKDLENSAFPRWKGWKSLRKMIENQRDFIGESVREFFSNDVLAVIELGNTAAEISKKRNSASYLTGQSIKIKNEDGNKVSILFKRCINLLNLVSSLPKGYIDVNSAVICTHAIMGFERFTVWSLAKKWSFFISSESGTKICTSEILEHLELFGACRRTLVALVLAVGSAEPHQRVVFQNVTSSSYTWLLVSVPAVATCSLDLLEKSRDNSVAAVAESSSLLIVRCTTAFFTFIGEDLINCLLYSHMLLPENERIKSPERSMPLESEYYAAAVSLTKALYKQMRSVMYFQKEMKLDCLRDCSHVSTANLQTEFYRIKSVYKVAASSAAARSFLWAITTFLDSMDRKCHLDKTSFTKWTGKLPTPLLSYLNDMELLVTCGLNQLLFSHDTGTHRDDIVNGASGRSQIIGRSRLFSMDGISHETRIDSRYPLKEQATRNEGGSSASDDDTRNISVLHMRENYRTEGTDLERNGDCAKDEHEFELTEGRQKELLTVRSKSSPGKLFELPEMSSEHKSILSSVLRQQETEQAKFLAESFMAMAAIIRLKSLFCSPNMLEHELPFFDNSWTSSLSLQMGAAHSLMSEAAANLTPGAPFCYSLILGVLKYVESIGSFLPHIKPTLSSGAFMRVVEVHIALFGALTTLGESNLELAKEFTNLKFHSIELGSTSRILSQQATMVDDKSVEEIKGALKSSFIMLLKKPLMLHLRTALQTIERAVLGFDGVSFRGYGVETGNLTSKRVRCSVVGAVECLSLCLDAISGKRRLQLLAKYCDNYLAAIFAIITHCEAGFLIQVPALPIHECFKAFDKKGVSVTPVLLKCIKILGAVISREAVFSIQPNRVAQAMHCPANIFKPFYEQKMAKYRLLESLSVSDKKSKSNVCQMNSTIHGCETLLNLYVACCKLLCSLLHHRKRECGHCMALLQDSMRALLFFLEISNQNDEIITNEAAVYGARWLKRVYEEIAEQKETFGKYCGYILSDYICVISGYGVTMHGLDREINDVLRPGMYALVDACSADSLQQLHAVLGEGPRRSALLALRSDYEKHFKYIGKV